MPRRTPFQRQLDQMEAHYRQEAPVGEEEVWDPVLGLIGTRRTPATTKLPPVQVPPGFVLGMMYVLGKPTGRMSGPPRPDQSNSTKSCAAERSQTGADSAASCCQRPSRASDASDDVASLGPDGSCRAVAVGGGGGGGVTQRLGPWANQGHLVTLFKENERF